MHPFLLRPFRFLYNDLRNLHARHVEGHKPNPGYYLKEIGRDPSLVTIAADRCLGVASEHGGPCKRCANLSAAVESMKHRATYVQGGRLATRSHATLVQNLKDAQAKIEALELKVCNLESSTSAETIAKWKQLYGLMARNEVPALQRLLATAYKEEVGIDGLLSRVQLAIDGKYRPKNYTRNDIDIGMTLYEFGGAGAVHAAHNSHLALPALKTLRKYRQDFTLHASTEQSDIIGDAGDNIEVQFAPRDDAPPRVRVGHSLAVDEMAGDGRVCYICKKDAIGGLCREHSGNLSSVRVGDDLANSMEAAEAVKQGKVHIGKEFTCAAILPHSRTNYGARPIIISPTCKHGLVSDSVQLLMSGIRAWQLSPFGERASGPLWYLTSDGDATRRNAMYKICMRKPLDPKGELYRRLRGCVGLNLWVGEGDLTMDFDYKHIFKRICTLLCSKDGLSIDKVVINKELLSIWLEKLTGYDWSEASIHALLHPKDAQDVPRAIKLLSRVAELRHLDTSTFTPSEKNTHRVLSLLGEALHSLLEPFINPDMDLPEQVTHLVKASHLFCALYSHHGGTAFMPNQLYADIQCMIKNAVFCVAKSQVLDPELDVYICLLGDDQLEKLFGRVRMLGGHSPNVDVSEMVTRCRGALNLADIFSRQPQYEREPERLRMHRSRDYDHLSPRDWNRRGTNVTGKYCNLELCWRKGVILATGVLRRLGVVVNFAAMFRAHDHDLMRPKGGDYPGVSKDIDRSLAESEAAESSSAAGELASQSEEATSDVQAVEAALTHAWTRLQARTAVEHSVWMKLDEAGRERHKTSILREVFDLTHDIDYHKTHDRILRIRCFSIGGDSWDRTTGLKQGKDLPSEERFEIGDLFATLVRLRSGQVSLAIAQCTGIKTSDSKSLAGAPRAEIALTDSAYTISGQTLALQPFRDDEGEIRWAWDRSFVAFEAVKTRQSTVPLDASAVIKKGQLVLNTPSSLVIPLRDEAESATVPAEVLGSVDETWVLSESTMANLRQRLWARICKPDSQLRERVATYGAVLAGSFPYCGSSTKEDAISASHIAGVIERASTKDEQRLPCRVCGQNVSGPDRQTHMGKHIFLASTGQPDESATEAPVSRAYPCGFCGGPSRTEQQDGCSVGFGAKNTAVSTCSQAHSFMIKSAAKASRAKPCTNVPMRCRLCPMIQWKYNMSTHLRERHPGWKPRDVVDDEFVKALTISEQEATELPLFGKATAQGKGSSRLKRRRSPSPSVEEATARSAKQPKTAHISSFAPPADAWDPWSSHL
ncbi:hypothetical protein BD626DRAFT_633076 [Schizophyllum amplum]|uniref:Uncharacterized protein n=1 Tax=Schizophyllum amplum TaxID=97359 RepID=A0A550C412_9AGAR|nr:hypothetical protein BD626DRAFT_633076 [Auriculariopsis ampla]